MQKSFSVRLYAALGAALLLTASPALAQFSPRPLNDPPGGETYHIEGFAGFWGPTADMLISVEELGIVGSTVDFKNDLGLTDRRVRDLRLVLRPARKHKFRFESIPLKYQEGPVTVNRDIVFVGQRYRVGIPLSWLLEWQTYRLGYEYDIVSRDRGFGGLILEAKYTRVRADLTTPLVTCPEPDPPACVGRIKGPVPAIGGIVRVYVVPNISITTEVTGLKIPKIQDKYEAHYADVDIFGTVNFTPNLGAQIGWRSIDVGLLFEQDTGSFVVKGMYFGLVARY